MEELKRCTQRKNFCPVSAEKYGLLFWMLFGVAAAVAITVNQLFDSPLLFSLYVYPVIFLAMIRIPVPFFVLFGFAFLGSVFLYTQPEPILITLLVSFAGLMLIVKRVIYISERNYQGKNEQEEQLMSTVFSLAKTIDARDKYTAFHSKNVAQYAKDIATELGLNQREIDSIYLAGLIHDIGKIGTPDHILQKDSRLSEEEYDIMKKHPEDGFQIIREMKRIQELGISEMVRHHHERMDGKGYPAGLRGMEIPQGARILCVADAFDAMTTNRSYRPKLAIETAAEELKRCAGAQFDPVAVKGLFKVLIRERKLVREDMTFSIEQAVIIGS